MAILILHTGNWSDYLGTFHPILVHFPIVLFVLTLVCDLLYGIGKPNGWIVGRWMLWGGTLMCIPTVASGIMTAGEFPPTDPLVYKHMLFALSTTSYAFLYSGFCLIALQKPWRILPVFYVALSVILVTLTSWTSDYGGLISHGETPFSQLPEKTQEIQK
jgi:uncharacterized membrane protein